MVDFPRWFTLFCNILLDHNGTVYKRWKSLPVMADHDVMSNHTSAIHHHYDAHPQILHHNIETVVRKFMATFTKSKVIPMSRMWYPYIP